MDFVDDVDLVTPARRGELDAPDDLLAHVVDARSACRVELVHVGMLARGDEPAVLARAVGLGGRALFAQKRFRQKARGRRLAGAAGPAEQVRMAHFVLFDGVLDRAFDMLLTHHVLENLRTVFRIQCLCHAP